MASPLPHQGPARSRDPYANSPFGWYGAEPAFLLRLERNLKHIPEPVTCIEGARELIYKVKDLAVCGDLEAHNLRIVFEPDPYLARHTGLPPCDYPCIYTDVDRPRKHNHADTGLCLWEPSDPPERRWQHQLGLHSLVELPRRHLFCELHWWRTGGARRGEWPVEDAPHGLPAARKRVRR